MQVVKYILVSRAIVKATPVPSVTPTCIDVKAEYQTQQCCEDPAKSMPKYVHAGKHSGSQGQKPFLVIADVSITANYSTFVSTYASVSAGIKALPIYSLSSTYGLTSDTDYRHNFCGRSSKESFITLHNVF